MFSKLNKKVVYRHKPSQNIIDLPSNILLGLRKKLDTGPEEKSWREFCSLLTSNIYSYRPLEVEKMAMEIYANRSPSDMMLFHLGGKGFNVKDLVEVLLQMELEETLMELIQSVPIEILKQPVRYEEVSEGRPLALKVEVIAFPYPSYQWFCYDDEVLGATEPILKIEFCHPSDSGNYCCRIHNPKNLKEVVFSDVTEVKVIPLPKGDDDEKAGKPTANPSPFPVIVLNPVSQTVSKGSTLTLKCEASGSLPMKYIWFFNKLFFTETSNPVLQVDHANECGIYECRVKNSFGEAQSQPARVVVNNLSISPVAVVRPEILSGPKSCIVSLGGTATFSCKVQGSQPLTFQWFKNSDPVSDSNTNELTIRNVTAEDVGIYQCLIKNHESKLSQGAVLQVCQPEISLPQYTATDKVALLIGNYDYRCEDPLNAPKTDTQNLAEILRHMGFKVVSLLNLTLKEMENAVELFSELLGQGVYGVFYFCGHGFEERREIYMVPQDAPAGYINKECMSADYVEWKMQKYNPAVCLLILDVCRTPNKVTSPYTPSIIERAATESTNTVFLYATSEGNQAYEYSSHGLLASHLQKYLNTNLSIEEVFFRVREGFGKEKLPNNCVQNPQLKSNLNQRRSLADKIVSTGYTQEFHRRQLDWEHCLETPPTHKILAEPKKLGIVLELSFHAEFANVLSIFITVLSSGKQNNCIAYIGRYPNSVTMMEGGPIDVSDGNNGRNTTKNTLQDIQKLKGPLEVSIRIATCPGGGDVISDETVVHLGLPLVSKLELWKGSPNLPHHHKQEAIEQDDRTY